MKEKETKEARFTKSGDFLPVRIEFVLIILLPVISVIIEKIKLQSPVTLMLVGKWLVFWTFGFRLFTSGIKQASNPLSGIRKNSNEVIEIMQELGITNICLGIGGILSLINETWRPIIAILGCLFFGLDTIRCSTGGLASAGQKFFLLFNLVIFVIFFLYVVCVFKSFQ